MIRRIVRMAEAFVLGFTASIAVFLVISFVLVLIK